MKPKTSEYHRKIIQITAEDSPNVRLAREEIRAGRKPSGDMMIPGVLSWDEYQKRLALWDDIRKSIGLFARFYDGAELKLYPQQWLDKAEAKWRSVSRHRKAKGIGVDPGEGTANTSMTAVDLQGVIAMKSVKTPDTSDIIPHVTSFVAETGCDWRDVTFDAGGGGKQIGHMLRKKGKRVRIVAFGESINLELKRGTHVFTEKRETLEERRTYANRRAQLYGTLRDVLDPSMYEEGFAIPPVGEFMEAERLRHQMSLIPKLYDAEERLIIPPKTRKAGQKPNVGLRTLIELIGYSPDELDSLVLAVDALFAEASRKRIGVS